MVHSADPPSLARTANPVKETENVVPSSQVADDEVNITRENNKAPEASIVLAKITTKGDPAASEKWKVKLELSNIQDLSADGLRQGYLSRLSTSRDMEASMVNMVKRKYVV
jgi:hypothetical protein